MSKVAIVTDSTVNLPSETIQALDIKLMHQILIWGGKTYLDLIDIQTEEFYRRLKVEKDKSDHLSSLGGRIQGCLRAPD